GATALPMLPSAGRAVAFGAQRLAKQWAKRATATRGLDGILDLLGFRDREGFWAAHPPLGRAGARPPWALLPCRPLGTSSTSAMSASAGHWLITGFGSANPLGRDRTRRAELGASGRSAVHRTPVRYSWEKLKFMLSLGGCR